MLEKVLRKLETVHMALLHLKSISFLPDVVKVDFRDVLSSQRVTEKFVCGMIGIHKIPLVCLLCN